MRVGFGLPCNGLGDTICATPTIRKISEAYDTPISVYSKHGIQKFTICRIFTLL